jgi:hypothetical protein
MKKTLGLIGMILILSQSLSAQTSVSVDLQRNSSLTILGSTNLLSFKLIQNGDKLQRKAVKVSATQNQNKIFLSQNQLSIAVKNFNSDNKIALTGFLKLVKSETYPYLNVQLNHLELPTVDTNKDLHTKALVNITITGVTKPYWIPIKAVQNGELYLLDGNKDINIRDFGLEPPVTMLGLVRVNEWININLHLICKITI